MKNLWPQLKITSSCISAFFVLIFISGSSFAVPITGSTLTAELGVEFGGGSFITQDTVSFVAGAAGTDSTGPLGINSVDVDASSILLSGLNISFNTACCDFNGYRIFDTFNVIDAFTNVSVNSLLTTAAEVFTLSFTADEIRLDWNGASSGIAVGDIVLNIETQAVSVPEPTTLLLISLGLAGLGFSRRKNILN